MPKYVLEMTGELYPKPGVLYKELNVELPSLSISIDEEKVIAIPKTGVQLMPDEAEEHLQREIVPVLAVIGNENSRDVTLRITSITPYDLTRPECIEMDLRCSSDFWTDAVIIRGSDHTGIIQKIRWAAFDPIYRDLLDFATEAKAAPNPRPSGSKMVERLEVKYGKGLKGSEKRQAACAALGMRKSDLNPITANQSQFEGDRDAEYDVCIEPARLDPVAKSGSIDRY
jgi:hypothetical protein